MSPPSILQLHQVVRKFSGAVKPAVEQINLTLEPGEILGLLGPSGCGKTTLLRLIAGFERPDAGQIVIAGVPVAGASHWRPPERRNVGMVFQDYALFPHLTVAQNVTFGLQGQRKAEPRQARQQAQAAIALVGLLGLENRYPHELSGGQQQRVALARALAPQPALILLDEPLSNLDVQVRLRLRQEVRDILKQTGTSAVFVTHDQEEALSIADRVAVMQAGRIEQFDTPEVIYQSPRTRFVAEFVTQANFVAATCDGSVWETEIGRFPCATTPPIATVGTSPANCPTVLMIRQEEIWLEPDETGEVVISDRQFLGRDHIYHLRCASGRMLSARMAATKALPIGIKVRLHINVAAIQPFPA